MVVLAEAGVGAEWDMYPGAGTPIQDAVDGAGAMLCAYEDGMPMSVDVVAVRA